MKTAYFSVPVKRLEVWGSGGGKPNHCYVVIPKERQQALFSRENGKVLYFTSRVPQERAGRSG